MRRILAVSLCSTLLLLSACSHSGDSNGESSSSSSSSEALVTSNVTYQGILEEIGVTTYQQGTHRLTLNDGRFIVLTSADPALDLDMYIGKRVEVMGSTQATVEAGGTIMAVEQVTDLDTESSSSSVSSAKMCGGIAGFQCDSGTHCIDNPNDSCDPKNGGADCGGICIPDTSSSSVMMQSSAAAVSSSASSKAMSSVAVSSVMSSVAPVSSAAASVAMSSVASTSVSAEMEARIVAAMKEDYTNSVRWTQSYCSTQMAFCIPAHKNWYYKSFGATPPALWRVEFDSVDQLETNGMGFITLRLLNGGSSAAGATSGQIVVNGSQAVGFLDWDGGRHFEVSGDARLKGAIEYMIGHITANQSTPS